MQKKSTQIFFPTQICFLDPNLFSNQIFFMHQPYDSIKILQGLGLVQAALTEGYDLLFTYSLIFERISQAPPQNSPKEKPWAKVFH